MIETYIRPAYQQICVDPVVGLLSRMTFISPNIITLMALLVGVLSAFLIPTQPIIAVVLLLFSGYLDTLDGSLARSRSISSDVGALLDVLFDRIVELAIMVALLVVDPAHRMWLVLVMIASTYICVTSFLLVGIFAKNVSQKGFYYSVGLMERPEAFVFYITMICLPQYFIPLAWIYSGLVLLTAVLRVVSFVSTSCSANVAR